MVEFDRRLLALADCPVLLHDSEDPRALGGILFNPHPVITAIDDGVLSHEICHKLSGKDAYDIYLTAILARDKNELFRTLLNLLFDCYDERKNEEFSGFTKSKVRDLHEAHPLKPPKDLKVKDVLALIEFYNNQAPISEISKHYGREIRDHIDLVVIADHIIKKCKDQLSVKLIEALVLEFDKNGAGSDIGNTMKRSDYYLKAIARYGDVIRELSDLWKRNKYGWLHHYFGEINWKNLPGMVLGQEMSLPVFLIFSKIVMAREVYLVVDRSGSTEDIKETIMDTTIIIAESLRRLKTPISVLDVGVTNSTVNKIGEELDLEWFTPVANGGTPIGRVCEEIKDASPDSYLLIITDGMPDCFDRLQSVLYRFPGHYMTFVIGPSFAHYAGRIRNVVSVEPHTIIKEMIRHEDLLSE
jgi:hypothetical protein